MGLLSSLASLTGLSTTRLCKPRCHGSTAISAITGACFYNRPNTLLLIGLVIGVSCSKPDDPPPTSHMTSSKSTDGKPSSGRSPASAGRAKYVIIVSIDGLRPDALEQTRTPHLMSLIRNGAYCPNGETVTPSMTLPGHTSMLTGLDSSKHGITWNSHRGGWVNHPTVFSVARAATLKTACFIGKDKLYSLANPAHLDWVFGPNSARSPPSKEGERHHQQAQAEKNGASRQSDLTPLKGEDSWIGCGEIVQVFSTEWLRNRYHLSFLHFVDPDGEGHAFGWMSDKYLSAVANVDNAIGCLMATLEMSGDRKRTAIIVTSDHGGSGREHYDPQDPNKAENLRIPWICVGPDVREGLIIGRVRITDTAPTALAFLGLELQDIDGQVVLEVMKRKQ